jgi:hypothetical protein
VLPHGRARSGRLGTVGRVVVGQGQVRLGSAGPGQAGQAGHGLVRRCKARQGTASRGSAGKARSVTGRLVTVRLSGVVGRFWAGLCLVRLGQAWQAGFGPVRRCGVRPGAARLVGWGVDGRVEPGHVMAWSGAAGAVG